MESSLRYLLVDLGMLAVAGLVLVLLRVKLHWRPLHVVLGVLLVLSVLFDNLLVAMDTFRYNPQLISGWLVGRAPIEDLAYTVAAAVLMPAIWVRLGRNSKP